MPFPYDLYDYTRFWTGRDYEDSSEAFALKHFFSFIKDRDFIVDVGGGFGRLAKNYATIFKNCLVIEPSVNNINQGKQLNKEVKNLTFQQGSLPKLLINDSSVSVVLMVRVSHHLRDLKPSLKEFNRVLKINGYLIIEIANKIHILTRIKSILKGNFSFTRDLRPLEKRSFENVQKKAITFVNHHPVKVISELESEGFKVVGLLSVSNFRHHKIKQLIPENILLGMEKLFQKPLAKIYFGPSIFILAQKSDK